MKSFGPSTRDLGCAVAIKTTWEQFNALLRALRPGAFCPLNHLNICILHDIGPNHLVMELAALGDDAAP